MLAHCYPADRSVLSMTPGNERALAEALIFFAVAALILAGFITIWGILKTYPDMQDSAPTSVFWEQEDGRE
jgi:hypothetical protein